MSRVERDGSGFVVSASLLAEAFRMTEEEVRRAMHEGSLTSTCEAGVEADAGRWRLTFRHIDRICRFTVDESGTILARSRFPVRTRPRQPPD